MKKGRKKYLLNVSGFGGKVDDALMISSSRCQSRVKLIFLQVNIHDLSKYVYKKHLKFSKMLSDFMMALNFLILLKTRHFALSC